MLRGGNVRIHDTWACGFEGVTPRMQYTASSFASPLLSVFGRLSGVRLERTGDSLHTHPTDLVLEAGAIPLWHALHRAATRLRTLQQGRGRLHVYLLFLMAALLSMLGYLALGSRP
jgi:hypothetical protein